MPFGRAFAWRVLIALAIAAPCLSDASPARAAAGEPRSSIAAAGTAAFLGSTGDTVLTGPLVDVAASRSGNGYWQLGSDGGVFSYGDAPFYGSTGDIKLNRPVVSMSPTSSGKGYWFVADDGGVFAYGDAGFFGSTGGMKLNKPVVGMAPTATGNGYFLVAADGGVFAFGDAQFAGSFGAAVVSAPVVSLSPLPSGDGYYMLDRAGDLYRFGKAEARFLTMSNGRQGSAFTDIQVTPTGLGFWVLDEAGNIEAYGDAARVQPEFALGPGERTVGLAPTPDGQGLWVSTSGRFRPSTQGESGPHKFLYPDRFGRPGRWNPCAPITWLFNPQSSPPGAEQFLLAAIDHVGLLTGLQFRYGGTTTLTPDVRVRDTVVVKWQPGLTGAAGLGGAWPEAAPGGALRLVAGGITLNADLNATRTLPGGSIPGLALSWTSGWGPVLLHEIGHVLGLDHVEDPTQIMYGHSGLSTIYFGSGDLAGLQQLGAGPGCL
jgi:matrixin